MGPPMMPRPMNAMVVMRVSSLFMAEGKPIGAPCGQPAEALGRWCVVGLYSNAT